MFDQRKQALLFLRLAKNTEEKLPERKQKSEQKIQAHKKL
jgi:hypothetical protein